jgi:dTDP-4-amino-4,6-dideoxygalactose transaminase
MPVHLYGQPAPMDRVLELARAHRLAVIEDAAQAIGGAWAEQPIGAWGDAACLSFYPTKNLGACGDGGMVVTRRQDVAERIAKLRHHGDSGRYEHVELGYCSRLDELQAAFLRVKLRRLADWTTARRRIASVYHKGLTNVGLELPSEAAKARHVYHLFTVRHPQRDALAKLLTDDGISTAIYYPRSVPDQPMFGAGAERRWPEAWRASREVLSLPCFAELTDDEVDRVVAGVRSACERL